MIHRKVGGSLLEVIDGIAALPHYLLDEVISFGERFPGRVDEVGLCVLPRSLVTLPGSGAKGADFELVVPFGPLSEVRLGLALAPLALHRPFVLGTELFLELLTLALLASAPHQPQDHEHNDRYEDPNPYVHLMPPCKR
jgi:hypothetical protein